MTPALTAPSLDPAEVEKFSKNRRGMVESER